MGQGGKCHFGEERPSPQPSPRTGEGEEGGRGTTRVAPTEDIWEEGGTLTPTLSQDGRGLGWGLDGEVDGVVFEELVDLGGHVCVGGDEG